MKNSIFSLLGLMILLSASTMIFNACADEQLGDFDAVEMQGKKVAIQAVCFGEEEELEESEEGKYFVVSGESVSRATEYCLYKVVEVVESDDTRDNAIAKGDIICYTCPDSNTCTAADCVYRTYKINVGECMYRTKVKLSGDAGKCTECPEGSRKIRTGSQGTPGS